MIIPFPSGSKLRRPSLVSIAAAAFLAACGGGDGGPNTEPPAPVLTTLSVVPSQAAIWNTAPGNAVTLTVTPRDQNAATLAGAGSPVFASLNSAVATVSAAGTVTAVAPGTAQITATVQAGTVTLTTPMSVTVQVPPSVAGVGSTGVPQPAYVPAIVHLASGGEVTWTFGAVQHSITFVSAGSPSNIPSIVNGSGSRTFAHPGTYNYVCDFHPTMSGTVLVH